MFSKHSLIKSSAIPKIKLVAVLLTQLSPISFNLIGIHCNVFRAILIVFLLRCRRCTFLFIFLIPSIQETKRNFHYIHLCTFFDIFLVSRNQRMFYVNWTRCLCSIYWSIILLIRFLVYSINYHVLCCAILLFVVLWGSGSCLLRCFIKQL